MERTDDKTKEMVMTDFRPNTSDKEPAINILIARAMVVDERLKLEIVGETWNSLEISGSKGWVPQRMAKVLKPPANKAKFTFLKVRVPR